MPRSNLTAISIEKLRPPAAGQVEHYDRRLPGFGLRLSYNGGKSWFVMTRLHGRLIRVTLGSYPGLSLADARDEARKTTRLTSEGKDPRLLRSEAKRKRVEEQHNTFAACATEFIAKHTERRLRPSTQREYLRILTGHDTREWRNKPVAQITKRDVLNVLETMEQRGSPGAAKRALAYLRKFFKWCTERDVIATAPTDRVPRSHPEVKRDRVLSTEELRYVVRAVNEDATIFGRVILLLLLTGQRRAEVAGLRWAELPNLDAEDPVWEIPGERTKNKQFHLVPLSAQVQRIICEMPRVGPLVFTTTQATPVSGFGKAKARIDRRIEEIRRASGIAPMAAWTLHDLRRTMVTVMNERLGVPPHVVEAVVNHASGLAKAGVAGVYNRALYLDDRRKALESWATLVTELGQTN
jgi:integrase